MEVLLLGGNGLLGHNVIKRLLQQGHCVHALLRDTAVLHVDDFTNTAALSIFRGSLLDDADLRRAAQHCDAIINCAGVTDMSLLRYEDYLPVNRDLCVRLLNLMEEQGVGRLVHVSTANTIGFGTPVCKATESAPQMPPFSESFYGRSKREGEQILLDGAARRPDWHIVIVNPGFMVGAYDVKPSSGKLLLAGYRKPLMLVPKGGKSFLHVGDAAVAVVNALVRGEHGHRYLLTGANLSLKAFYRIQAHVCGYRQRQLAVPNWLLSLVGLIGDGLRRCGLPTSVAGNNVRQLMVAEYYDAAAAREALELPQTPIDDAIREFFSWYMRPS